MTLWHLKRFFHWNRFIWHVLFATVAVIGLKGAVAQTPPGTPTSSAAEAGKIIHLEKIFSIAVPEGWSGGREPMFGLSADEKKAWGAILYGPSGFPIQSKIEVHYYGDGSLQHPSLERYLQTFTRPPLGVALKGSTYGDIVAISVSGRAAQAFEREKNEFVPFDGIGIEKSSEQPDHRVYERREMKARPVPVRERHIVMPATGGFYALRYTANKEDFARLLPNFEAVVASFRPER